VCIRETPEPAVAETVAVVAETVACVYSGNSQTDCCRDCCSCCRYCCMCLFGKLLNRLRIVLGYWCEHSNEQCTRILFTTLCSTTSIHEATSASEWLYCYFTTACLLLSLLLPVAVPASTSPRARQSGPATQALLCYCFTTALLLLYHCFANALLHYCLPVWTRRRARQSGSAAPASPSNALSQS
jgi:hypothetical protein